MNELLEEMIKLNAILKEMLEAKRQRRSMLEDIADSILPDWRRLCD